MVRDTAGQPATTHWLPESREEPTLAPVSAAGSVATVGVGEREGQVREDRMALPAEPAPVARPPPT
jgi:hypothetical protein